MNSFKKLGKRRNYKERGQPINRKKHGILPKHKDYAEKARAKDSTKKQLERLKRAAATRNPDEFYFKMEKSVMKDTYHEDLKMEKEQTVDTKRILKTQNLNYLSYKRQIDLKKIDKLQASLHFLDAPPQNKRTIFVDNDDEIDKFDPVSYYNTVPEGLDRHYNIPTKESLENAPIFLNEDNVNKDYIKWQKEHSYKELQGRLKREEKIRTLEQTTMVNKQILGAKKGQYKVIDSGSSNSVPIVKWRRERKS